MEDTSSRSFRVLQHERFGAPVGIFSMAVLLAGLWTAWLFFGSIARYAVTETARLEAEGQAHAVIALMNGVVVASYMTLGEEVARGQLLAELESVDMQFDLVGLQAKRAGLTRQIESTRHEMDAQDHALRDTRRSVSPALAEARARVQEADVAAELAERRVARTKPQHDLQYVSEVYWDSVSSSARQKRALANALRASLTRIDVDGRVRESEKKAQLAALASQLGRLEADLASIEATAAHVEHDRQHSFVVAPASGHLGEIVPLQPGATVHDGDRLGAVIPSGRLRAVATFPAAEAIGRIRPGQTARLRLTSLPWVQYGTLMAKVTNVANEGAQGNVRVELVVQGAERFPAPLEHGFAATLEVEVERVSPIALILRAVGRRFDRATLEHPSGVARVTSR